MGQYRQRKHTHHPRRRNETTSRVPTPFPKTLSDESVNRGLVCADMHSITLIQNDIHILDGPIPATKTHPPSKKTECDYLYGWIKKHDHIQKDLTKMVNPLRYSWEQKKKPLAHLGTRQEKVWKWTVAKHLMQLVYCFFPKANSNCPEFYMYALVVKLSEETPVDMYWPVRQLVGSSLSCLAFHQCVSCL